MKLLNKIKNIIRGRIQRWGSVKMKQRLWDKEFSEGRWDFIEHTKGDAIYGFIQRYCRGGSILDLGCGSGNTGCELDAGSYKEYTGVDISDVALARAATRSRASGREAKNRYFPSDIVAYAPDRKHDVILLRESIYYIPRKLIKATLERYSRYLNPDGVLIVRWHDAKVSDDFVKLIDTSFQIVERCAPSAAGPVILILRP